jgi:hypothetical protein
MSGCAGHQAATVALTAAEARQLAADLLTQAAATGQPG